MTDPAKPLYQQTALDLIDTPALPARETMDEDELAHLVESIRELGILQPIGLKRNGARYEVVYGHRRTMAARRLELQLVPTIVFPDGYSKAEAAKLHENIRREELNAGEEAVYFAQLLESMPTPDTDDLALQLNVTRSYVEDRLVLLRGDEYVLDALKRGQIKLTVAHELNKVKADNVRRDLLGYAISQGASARTVKNWRVMQEAMADMSPAQIVQKDTAAPPPTNPQRNPMACLLCDGAHEPHNMVFAQLHTHCIKFFERQTGLALVGFFAEPPASDDKGDAQ